MGRVRHDAALWGASELSWTRFFLCMLCAISLTVPTVGVRAQSALPPAVDAFVSASNALAKAANERVDLGRSTERLTLLRSALTQALLDKPNPAKISIQVDLTAFLCDVRANNVEVAARRNFIQSIAARIDEVGKPSKIDNLETAFKSLVSSQSLDITVALPTDAALASAKQAIIYRCKQDLVGYLSAYYGNKFGMSEPMADTGPVEAVPAFTSIAALIDTISKIITPVVVEGAKIIDEQRRREAILDYLGTPGNIKRIEDSGVALARQISTFTWDKRLRLAGSVVELATVIRHYPVDLAKDGSCQRYSTTASALVADRNSVSDDFILCYRVSWAQLESIAAALLKAADQYDQLADAGDTDNAKKAFEPLAKSLTAISSPGEDGLAKFWNWAIRLIAFGQKVESAFNKESRDKISKAIDDLVKTF